MNELVENIEPTTARCPDTHAFVLMFSWLKIIKALGNADITDQLKTLFNEGYTHLIATVNNRGKVKGVEVIRDTSDTIDKEVEQFTNRTGEGMVVVYK